MIFKREEVSAIEQYINGVLSGALALHASKQLQKAITLQRFLKKSRGCMGDRGEKIKGVKT